MTCQNKCLYSLSWDANKGIALITYDRYSMPMSLQFTNGNTTEYVHSATGEKLKAVHRTAVSNISVPVGSTVALDASNTLSVDSTTYAGDFVFENGQLSKYLFDGGYATFANGQPVWHYYYWDHLGNVRAVVSHDGTVEQRNHYYPFGAVYGDVAYNDGLQKYKYNGKELDCMHGLNFYDYGARQYDPLLGMFTQMDPLAEKYYGISPYAYCANNPVNTIDPDGRSTWVLYHGNGQYKIFGGNLNDKDRNIYVGYISDQHVFVPQHSIGISSSITSFYNSDPGGGWQTNSIIDLNDKSGDRFLSQIIGNNPPMFDDYMINARNNRPYDFKVTNGTGKVIDGIDIYRGMPIGVTGKGQTIYSSARDIGNIVAGYVAAVNGMSWKASRIAFDMYQGDIEGASTRNAEYYGWKMGYNNTTNDQKADNLLKSFGSMLQSMWNYIFK